MVPPGRALPGDADLVILPGSKSTIADLAAAARARAGTSTSRRICAAAAVCSASARGYQMLGRRLADPAGIEGPAGSVAGLGLLDLATEMTGDKTLTAVSGRHMRQRTRRCAAMRCISAAPRDRPASDPS